MKVKENKKVGRPKLADNKTKKESLFVCLFVFVVIIIVAVLGYNILSLNIGSKYIVGTIYNDHINSCIIKDNMIDCGPNVIQLKYKLDNENYKEMLKKDKSIKVKINDYKNIEICYKTKDSEIKCNTKNYQG